MKFIILCGARTGSNFLSEILKSSSDIRIHGELFNLNSLRQKNLTKVLQNPVKYLEDQLSIKNQTCFFTSGFKIFYYHANRECLYPGNYPDKNTMYAPSQLKNNIQKFHEHIQKNYNLKSLERKLEEVWDYLQKDPFIRVIHLKRKNRLKAFLSLRRAFITDQWISYSGKKSNIKNFLMAKNFQNILKNNNYRKLPSPIHLSYDDCLESFEKNFAWEKKYDDFFKNHNKIDIFYEDLCTNMEIVAKKLFTFLEIPYQERITITIEKQNRLSLSHAISNYKELKEAFKDSQWYDFFVD